MLYNLWLVKVYKAALDDEVAVIGRGISSGLRLRGLFNIIEKRRPLATLDPATGESILWDDMSTEGVKETRTQVMVKAFLDALTEAKTLFPDAASPADYRWGELHRLNLRSLFPLPGGGLDLPGPFDDRAGKGYARPGGQFAVNVCNPGFTDFSFGCGSGPILRMCVDLDPAGVRTYNMLPGGETVAPQSPHYADWLPRWLVHEPTFWPIEAQAVADQAESHTVLRPER